MEGAFIGDIAGSIYEWKGRKTKEFPLFQSRCHATDDSFMTLAVAMAFREAKAAGKLDVEGFIRPLLVKYMQQLGRKYPHAGFGYKFKQWLFQDNPQPYGSFGNGAAMRVSPAGWYGETMEQVQRLAVYSCNVTHNAESSYKAAKAVAGAIFLARNKATKQEIRTYLETFYDLDFTVAEIRDTYRGDATCDGSVPEALVCFLDSTDFEDAIRNAISLGADTDTQAAIAGSIAEPFYGIPDDILRQGRTFYTAEMREFIKIAKSEE